MYFPYGASRPKPQSTHHPPPSPNYQQQYTPPQPAQPPANPAPMAQQAGSLGALPASHGELRQRLEAAGVPPDQIAAVLLQPDAAAGDTGPTLPPRPVQQAPQYQAQYNSYPIQQQPQSNSYPVQPVQPNYPAHPQQSSNLVFQVHNSPIEENFRANHQDYCTHVLVAPGSTPSNPSYTTVFSTESNFHKSPHLLIYRNVGNNLDKSARREIGSCMYHHEMSEKIEIKHPWFTWDKWEPELGWWTSDVGTLQGAKMQWEYAYSDPSDKEHFVIRNATLDGLEVCKVTLLGEDSARIELAGYAFEGCTEEQRDEMVCNAVIQMFRKWAGWTTEKKQHTKDARKGKGLSSAAVTANRINRMNASIIAAGGGGGGGGGC